ncbi:sensor histidine kinase [Agarilytica rhodophyticola]|uniref:sensor histidine kinase n=1 Tax=Agarilytica rhodophyticola TaxID=1737490 RepID=UPI000B342348|nr:ATP-binding protein [Agarilytica rhodophyticola]
MPEVDYKAAYERQKKAREIAENNLENKSRELFESNQSLVQAYNRLKDQKAQLLHQEKLASIGQLAAGVAHEINNPTGFVKSNLRTMVSYAQSFTKIVESYEDLINDTSNGDTEIKSKVKKIRRKNDLDFIMEDMFDLLEESLEGTERIEDIVMGLKNFARPDQDEKQLFSLNECIESTLKLVNNEVKYKADIELDLGEIPEIEGKPGAISQVILNLVVNAADAIPEHGNIFIATAVDKKEIKMSIRDNGSGIPQDILTKIYDPFFTTKEVGKGTGLGLAISHGIIQKHGGRLTVESKEGEGTEFTIALPVTEQS